MTEEIHEGLAYALRHSVLRPLFVALTATSVGLGLTTTLPHLLSIVRTGTTGLGLLMAAGG